MAVERTTLDLIESRKKEEFSFALRCASFLLAQMGGGSDNATYHEESKCIPQVTDIL